ncbi:MAG: TraR/DksA C4-type zinc finger protein, partial [Streptosporangiales bacterium]|nr:TraR/DksA C4-type zinc finger protein [Streptosporangiales bacterium]
TRRHRRDRLAEMLPELRAQLEEQRRFRAEQLAALDGHADGAADETDARRAVDAAIAEAARWALHEIEAALHRVDEGRYGVCVTCGEAIGLERLEVLPHTRYCPVCQPA